jgi:hydrogenase nickel incorporation protein HypA/HybF
MHELALMDDLVDVVAEQVGDARVQVVRLEVGRHAGASVHALRFCFELCTSGTVLEGAELVIVETPDNALRLRDVEVS